MGSLSSKRIPTATQVMAATQFVKDSIAHDKVVIFSKSDCGYCKMAKEVRINIYYFNNAFHILMSNVYFNWSIFISVSIN